MTTKRPGNTQRDNIKQFLKDGYSLTALEALSLFGAYRLAAHIHILRERDGMPIVKTMNKDVTGRTYARYSLVSLQDFYKGALGQQIHDGMWKRFITQSLDTKETVHHA